MRDEKARRKGSAPRAIAILGAGFIVIAASLTGNDHRSDPCGRGWQWQP